PPGSVLAPEEALGKKVHVKTSNGFPMTVNTDLASPSATLQLNDVSKLAKDDVILVKGKEYVLTENPDSMTKKVTVTPQITDAVKMGDPVKKVSTNVVSAGTQRTITVENADGLSKGSHFFF